MRSAERRYAVQPPRDSALVSAAMHILILAFMAIFWWTLNCAEVAAAPTLQQASSFSPHSLTRDSLSSFPSSAPDFQAKSSGSQTTSRGITGSGGRETMDLGINLLGNVIDTSVATLANGNNPFVTHESIEYFAAKGFSSIRLPIEWEKLQPTLNGALDRNFLILIHDIVNHAADLGLRVTLDVHNYGKYDGEFIGSAAVPVFAFADLWSKLASEFVSDSMVEFDLMNEPLQPTAAEWLVAANAAIGAIRATGAAQRIYVPGTHWDGAWSWTTTDNGRVMGAPGAVVDPLNNFVFQVHQYLDDTSGRYEWVVSPTIGVERLQAVTAWAREIGAKLYLGEFGVAENAPAMQALDNMMAYMKDNADVWVSAAYFTGGFLPPGHFSTIEPELTLLDGKQMEVLEKHLNYRQVETRLSSGMRQVDTLLPGASVPSLTDMLDASGKLASRAVFDDEGHLLRKLTLAQTGLSLAYYDTNAGLITQLKQYTIDKALLSDQTWNSDRSSVTKFFADNPWISIREEWRDISGQLFQEVRHTDTLHTVSKYVGRALTEFERYDKDWSFLNRKVYNDGHVVREDIARPGGDYLIEHFNPKTGLITGRGEYASIPVWKELSWTSFDAAGHITTTMGSEASNTITGDGYNNVVTGGAGNDLILGAEGDDTLYGNQDGDVLYGNQGKDWLHGGQGDDRLFGGQADDVVNGGLGNDQLQGNLGNDIFVFAASFGHDIISDFGVGADCIQFMPGTFANYDEMISRLVQSGADTLITLDANNTVLLQGVLAPSLTPEQFWFG